MDIRITPKGKSIYVIFGLATIVADEITVKNYPKSKSLTATNGKRTVAIIHGITDVKADDGMMTEQKGNEITYRIGNDGRIGGTDNAVRGKGQ